MARLAGHHGVVGDGGVGMLSKEMADQLNVIGCCVTCGVEMDEENYRNGWACTMRLRRKDDTWSGTLHGDMCPACSAKLEKEFEV